MDTKEIEGKIGTFVPAEDDDLIICRCEEITKGEIRRAVHSGMYTFNMVKRYLRVGMGLCQGQSCQTNVRRIIAGELGIPLTELGYSTPRPPIRPVRMEGYRKDVYIIPTDEKTNRQAEGVD